MATWDYRVIRHKNEYGTWLSIHEVFYDEDGNLQFWCEFPSAPFGDNQDGQGLEQLVQDAEWILEACGKPIIDDDGLNAQRIDEWTASFDLEDTVPWEEVMGELDGDGTDADVSQRDED